MKKSYPYINDNNFLLEIDKERLLEQYVKIIILNWDENPIKEVQGIITSGSLSLNGKSSLRRTGNLSAVIDKSLSSITDANNLFSINKKIYLEIGLKNNTNKYNNYPIIWFPQGTFIITGCNLSHSTSGINITIQIKDKMCLLNGECGGTITASTQLDRYDTIDENGNWVVSQPTISQIIRELVNHFGGEQLGKILISDIDERIKCAMRWIGSEPVYWYKDGQGSSFLTTDYSIASTHSGYKTYSYGDDLGYIYSDFIYNGDLIADAGNNVCTILDKIVTYLGGNFEYFYDINGNFIFQEIKNYLNTTQATIELDKMENSDYILDITKGKSVYDFTNSPIITAVTNNPQYNNIKNDYVVWGIRQNAEGIKIPIRYHLAIDTKPEIGNFYQVFFYNDPDDGLTKAKMPIRYNSYEAIEKNKGAAGVFYQDVSTGKIYIWSNNTYEEIDNSEFVTIKTTDWRSELYLQGVAAEPLGLDSNYYYAELEAEWPKLYNLKAIEKIDEDDNIYYEGAFYEDVVKYPTDIDYFLDFIDTTSKVSQFNINNIGRRSIVENKDDFNCVFEQEILDYVIIEIGDGAAEKREECEKRGQEYIQVDSGIYSMLATGGIHNSCFDEVKNLLWTNTDYNNSISITAIPIFHLEPNIRITVNSDEDDIHGDFIINTISVPLAINGTMSISATKVIAKL